MPPSRHSRKSRKIPRKSSIELSDFDWQASFQLHSGFDINSIPLPPPSPSACTTTSSESPDFNNSHLPFTPGSSHTRNRKEGHIPRPPNAFMVFRSWLWNNNYIRSLVRDNRSVSRIAGRFWNDLSEAQRAYFRCLAEEAKARHAQLYPDYKYSPGSQKKPKVSQNRPQCSIDLENERCKKIADLLFRGITSCDLEKYLGEEYKKVKTQEPDTPVAKQTSSGSRSAAPRIALKRPVVPRGESPPQLTSNKPNTLPAPLICTLPVQYAAPLPILPVTEESSETTQTPVVLVRTPEFAYPPGHVQEFEFVPTADIPHLSLDGCSDLTVEKHQDDDLTALFPSHLNPGSHTILSGVKPEATSFVDSCMLGAHTTDVTVLPSPVPFTELGLDYYPSLVPLGSPIFSNPFEPSIPAASHSALLDTLDQLFGQPISPLTSIFPSEI